MVDNQASSQYVCPTGVQASEEGLDAQEICWGEMVMRGTGGGRWGRLGASAGCWAGFTLSEGEREAGMAGRKHRGLQYSSESTDGGKFQTSWPSSILSLPVAGWSHLWEAGLQTDLVFPSTAAGALGYMACVVRGMRGHHIPSRRG